MALKFAVSANNNHAGPYPEASLARPLEPVIWQVILAHPKVGCTLQKTTLQKTTKKSLGLQILWSFPIDEN